LAILTEENASQDGMRLFVISSVNEEKHVPGVLRMLVEAADLPAKFVVDLCERGDWAIIPTAVSTVSAGSDLTTNACQASVVLQYGFYGSLEAMSKPSFVLQVIKNSTTTSFYCIGFPETLTAALQNYLSSKPHMMQDPLFINILILEYILRSYQMKIAFRRNRLRDIEKGRSKDNAIKQAETLHELSVNWHSILRSLENIKQHIDKLLLLHNEIATRSPRDITRRSETSTAADDLHHFEDV
jgi:hypothetical protein